jgi:NAD(P)-dependent dehydrogenase (short-subunit alcohol dehydrogenase family)
MAEIANYPSLFTLTSKTAVVTGGSRGLGLHAASGLLHAGCSTLIITSRKADGCATAVRELQAQHPAAKILAIPADLSKLSEVERFVKAVDEATGGRVDILVANAGATWGAPLESHPDEGFAKVMDLNVRSVFNLVKLMVPLLERAAAERGGDERSRVVTVGSVAGIVVGGTGVNGTYGYAASKAAVMVCHHPRS